MHAVGVSLACIVLWCPCSLPLCIKDAARDTSWPVTIPSTDGCRSVHGIDGNSEARPLSTGAAFGAASFLVLRFPAPSYLRSEGDRLNGSVTDIAIQQPLLVSTTESQVHHSPKRNVSYEHTGGMTHVSVLRGSRTARWRSASFWRQIAKLPFVGRYFWASQRGFGRLPISHLYKAPFPSSKN
jgi:hypothetical protein